MIAEFSFWREVKKDFGREIRKWASRLVLWLINHFSINPEEFWSPKELRKLNFPRKKDFELCRTTTMRGQPCTVIIRTSAGGVLHVRVVTVEPIDRYFLLREIERVAEAESCVTLLRPDRVIVVLRNNGDPLDFAGYLHFRMGQLIAVTEVFLDLPRRVREYYQIPATVPATD